MEQAYGLAKQRAAGTDVSFSPAPSVLTNQFTQCLSGVRRCCHVNPASGHA
jgi:hypothetical protein